tara:strand:- start:795 stop:1121 length:327 start_codon:yes stop_codon:yes gene_type:complete
MKIHFFRRSRKSKNIRILFADWDAHEEEASRLQKYPIGMLKIMKRRVYILPSLRIPIAHSILIKGKTDKSKNININYKGVLKIITPNSSFYILDEFNYNLQKTEIPNE